MGPRWFRLRKLRDPIRRQKGRPPAGSAQSERPQWTDSENSEKNLIKSPKNFKIVFAFPPNLCYHREKGGHWRPYYSQPISIPVGSLFSEGSTMDTVHDDRFMVVIRQDSDQAKS